MIVCHGIDPGSDLSSLTNPRGRFRSAAILGHLSHRARASDVDTVLVLAAALLASSARVGNALLDIPRKLEESLFDVDVALGADFHEWDAQIGSKRLALLG